MLSTIVANQIATLTMSSPPVNALSNTWLAQFDREIDQLEARGDWKVLYIRSDQKAFSAGGDLKEMEQRFSAPDCADQSFAYSATIQRLYARIEGLSRVTMAEISGAAIGGGLELALSCDLRIAANEAKIAFSEVKLGLVPAAGGTQRLTRLIGSGLAKRLILGAEMIDGATAEKLGVVQWAYPRVQLPAKAMEIAQRVAGLPDAALQAAKLCINSAATPGRGGFMDELETSRALQLNAETRKLVGDFLKGAR